MHPEDCASIRIIASEYLKISWIHLNSVAFEHSKLFQGYNAMKAWSSLQKHSYQFQGLPIRKALGGYLDYLKQHSTLFFKNISF